MYQIIECDHSDPRLDMFRDLKHPRLSDFFIAEGRMVVERLLTSNYNTHSLLIAERRWPWAEKFLAEHAANYSGPIMLIPDDQIDSVVGFDFHSGILAAGRRSNPLPSANQLNFSTWLNNQIESVGGHAIFAVLPHLDLADNLGSIIRSAWALGCAGLIMDQSGADPLGRRVLRVSMGHALSLPIYRSAESLESIVPVLRHQEVSITAIEAQRTMQPLRQAKSLNRQALVFGNEFTGVPQVWLNAADQIVGIPMQREVDSLNVAVTAAITLHHYCS